MASPMALPTIAPRNLASISITVFLLSFSEFYDSNGF
jgi:hypothetical protein